MLLATSLFIYGHLGHEHGSIVEEIRPSESENKQTVFLGLISTFIPGKKNLISNPILWCGFKKCHLLPVSETKSDDASKANLAKVLALQSGNYFHCQMIPLALQHSQ